MRGFSPSGGFLHRRAAPGVDLLLLPTRRFKTVTVRLVLLQPLRERPAAALALSGSVLKQGTARHPGRTTLYGALDGLYGADLTVDASRLGEVHLLEMELDVPSDRWTGDPAGFRKALDLLGEVVGAPRRVGAGFDPAFVREERRNILDAIRAARNHKPGYATARCLQAACAREPFRVGRYGSPRALQSLTPAGLWDFWEDAAASFPVLAYAVGDFDPARMADDLAGLLLPLRRGTPHPLPAGGFRRASPSRPKRLSEAADVAQSRLCLAFRANTAWDDPGFTAHVMAANVLGGGSQAKLFREVREKASLAYDAYASLEKTKGLMLLTAGVAHKDRARAEALMLDQVEAVRAGRIARAEWSDGRRTLLNRVKTLPDSPGRLIGSHLEGWLHGAPRSVPEILAAVKRTTPEEAAAAARRWAHAATFALTGRRRRAR